MADTNNNEPGRYIVEPERGVTSTGANYTSYKRTDTHTGRVTFELFIGFDADDVPGQGINNGPLPPNPNFERERAMFDALKARCVPRHQNVEGDEM